MGAPRRHESGGGRAEHELENLASLAANLEPPTLLVNGEHGGAFKAAAEVGDPRLCPDAGEGT